MAGRLPADSRGRNAVRPLSWLERQREAVQLAVLLAAVAAVGLVERWTGTEVAFSIFYLAPTMAAAWAGGRHVGLLIALAGGCAWLVADLTSGHAYSAAWIPYWNMAVRIGFFVTVALLVSRVKADLVRLNDLARTDPLTGVWNTRYFLELMERESERCRRNGHPISLAYIDMDNFKSVNDTHGHAAGDALLRQVAGAIKGSVRLEDVPGRLGGDEFALLLPDTGYDESSVVLRRLQEHLGHVARAGGHPLTFSIGAITFATPLASVKEMITAADDLMYQVKRSGKGAIRHETAGPAARRSADEGQKSQGQ
jgi:diguanylate cyclase (GGDEF)-like protein